MIPIADRPRFLSQRILVESSASRSAASGCFGHFAHYEVVGHGHFAGFLEQGGSVASQLRAERDAPHGAFGGGCGHHEAHLRWGVGIELRQGEEVLRPRVAVGAGDGDSDFGTGAAHLAVAAHDDARLSGADGHAFTAGGGSGMLGVLRADHGEELRATGGFLYLNVYFGVGQGLAHLLAHGVGYAELQAFAVGRGVQFAVQEDAPGGGTEVAQFGAQAVARGEEPDGAAHQQAADAGYLFRVFLAGAQGGHLAGEVVHREAFLQLGLKVIVVLYVLRQCQVEGFER